MVNQFYDAEIIKEYVIRGNTAVLKCSIPSFVADFVYVDSWIDETGFVYTAAQTDKNYGAKVDSFWIELDDQQMHRQHTYESKLGLFFFQILLCTLWTE